MASKTLAAKAIATAKKTCNVGASAFFAADASADFVRPVPPVLIVPTVVQQINLASILRLDKVLSFFKTAGSNEYYFNIQNLENIFEFKKNYLGKYYSEYARISCNFWSSADTLRFLNK